MRATAERLDSRPGAGQEVHEIMQGLVYGYAAGYSPGMPRQAPYRLSFLQPSFATRLFAEVARALPSGDAPGAYWTKVEGGNLPWPILIRLGITEGRLVVTGLLAGAQDEVELTSRALRGISIPQVTQAIATAASKPGGSGEIATALFLETAAPRPRPRPRPGPRGYDKGHFRDVVAPAYRGALRRQPRSPMTAAAAALNTTLPTARRWVQRARDLGYLGPSPLGKAGEEEGSDG